MKYPELIKKLFQVNLFGGMKLGLENMLQLNAALNFPAKKFASVHVAGTNGKGSVTKKIAAGLEAAGYRVGLYISPHISSFRERISINGQLISESEIEPLLNEIFDLTISEEIPATFFEITTMLAFKYFADQNVDYAVIETGLGGRFDATNIIKPQISVITSISLDHTEILGKTIEEIANEKSGIIKTKIPVVLGPRVPQTLFFEAAKRTKSPCIVVSGSYDSFEDENRAIANAALDELKIPEEAIEKGLDAHLPCRFEIAKKNPLVVLDVGHNPDGISKLLARIKQNYPNHQPRFVIGLSKTKDIPSCLNLLKDSASAFYLIEAPNGRGAPVKDLKKQLLELHYPENQIFTYDSIAITIQNAMEACTKPNEMVVVCGSFFIMGKVRQALGYQDPQDEIDMNETNVSIN